MPTRKGNSESDGPGGDGNQGDGGKPPKRGGGKKTPGGKPTKLPMCSLANNMTPSFYIGGGNGVALVEAPLLALGWKRTSDKYDERFRLKWVECKSKINYSAFREGDQLVNHIANCQLLTNKMGLLNSLQEYERVTLSTKGRLPRLKMADFVPETYRLDNREDRETFLEVYKDNEIWISKPTGMNQGKGIFLLRSRDEIDKVLSEREARQQSSKPSRPLMSRIVQRYIHNPLLLDERKFDIRAYMLIASTIPYLVLYHKGYVRLSCQKYDGEDTNLTTHLTNQFIQKKVAHYNEVKEETAWSMDKFNDYINEKVAPEKGIEQNWVYNTLTKQMQRIIIHCFNSVKHKLQCKIGYFDLYGLDFMVDQNMKISLIEININPCLAINCEALREVIPGIVEETLYLSLECFEKSRKHQPLMPLSSLKTFTVLYCGSNPNAVAPRQTRSVSPAKENNSDKNRSTQPAQNQRQGRSPSRPVPRLAISTTPLTTAGSPYQTRKSEFSSILNSQGAGAANSKTNNNPRGGSLKVAASTTSSTTTSNTSARTTASKSATPGGNNTTGNDKKGNVKSDNVKSDNVKSDNANGNKNNSANSASPKTADPKPVAKSAETKNAVSKSVDTKTTVTKSVDTKTAVSKSVDNKAPVTKSVDNKTPVTKSADNKAPVTKSVSAKTTNLKNGETKSSESKNGEAAKNIKPKETEVKTETVNGKDSGKEDTRLSPVTEAETTEKGGEESSQVSTTTAATTVVKNTSSTTAMKTTSSPTVNGSKPETSPGSPKVSSSSNGGPKKAGSTSLEVKLGVKSETKTVYSSLSSSGTVDDVKLKMTHAKNSANRKNRPRAETGN